MSTLAQAAEAWRRVVRRRGKGPPVDGVYVLQTADCVVYADHNGQPVDPDDQGWNSDAAIAERRSAKLQRQS